MSRPGPARTAATRTFPVGSLLIAPRCAPHVHAFYAFARNADDIADSAGLSRRGQDRAAGHHGGRAARPARRRLAQCRAAARAAWPRPASRRSTPRDLLIAFRRDATKLRYANWDELYDYCRYSAMPVGRHVLDLHGEDRATLRAVRRAVHLAAGAEPSAGLRARICASWIAATCRRTCCDAFRCIGRRSARPGGDAGAAPGVRSRCWTGWTR